MTRVSQRCLSSDEDQGAVAKREERVQSSEALVTIEVVCIEEDRGSRQGIDAGAMFVDIARIPHRHPVSECNRDVPHGIDGTGEVEVDEADRSSQIASAAGRKSATAS